MKKSDKIIQEVLSFTKPIEFEETKLKFKDLQDVVSEMPFNLQDSMLDILNWKMFGYILMFRCCTVYFVDITNGNVVSKYYDQFNKVYIRIKKSIDRKRKLKKNIKW